MMRKVLLWVLEFVSVLSILYAVPWQFVLKLLFPTVFGQVSRQFIVRDTLISLVLGIAGGCGILLYKRLSRQYPEQ